MSQSTRRPLFFPSPLLPTGSSLNKRSRHGERDRKKKGGESRETSVWRAWGKLFSEVFEALSFTW